MAEKFGTASRQNFIPRIHVADKTLGFGGRSPVMQRRAGETKIVSELVKRQCGGPLLPPTTRIQRKWQSRIDRGEIAGAQTPAAGMRITFGCFDGGHSARAAHLRNQPTPMSLSKPEIEDTTQSLPTRCQCQPRLIAMLLVALCVSPACGWSRDLPDLDKTPGKSRPGLTKDKICAIKWGKDARHVTEAMKDEAFGRYGYSGYDDHRCTPDVHGATCEIDHLISRELGGADDVDNLWPQSFGGRWNAHLKDTLENRLHKELCAGNLSLKAARQMLLLDWRKAYRFYYGRP